MARLLSRTPSVPAPDLPVEAPNRCDLTVNLKTAQNA
jgi:hypothetical protein